MINQDIADNLMFKMMKKMIDNIPTQKEIDWLSKCQIETLKKALNFPK